MKDEVKRTESTEAEAESGGRDFFFAKLKEREDFSEERFVFQRKQDHGNTFKLQDLYSKKTTLENFQIYSQSNRNFSTDHPLNVRRKVQITEC